MAIPFAGPRPRDRSGKVGTGKVGTGKVGTGKVGTGKVGTGMVADVGLRRSGWGERRANLAAMVRLALAPQRRSVSYAAQF
jgi:hypothetical protein